MRVKHGGGEVKSLVQPGGTSWCSGKVIAVLLGGNKPKKKKSDNLSARSHVPQLVVRTAPPRGQSVIRTADPNTDCASGQRWAHPTQLPQPLCHLGHFYSTIALWDWNFTRVNNPSVKREVQTRSSVTLLSIVTF